MNRPLRRPTNAVAIPQCPCCGHAVAALADLQWNALARTLTGRGWAIALSPHKSKIFDLLWRRLPTGVRLERSQIMDALYADDPNGGPDADDCVKQRVFQLKQQLKPFGLSIKGRCGYALVQLRSAA